VAVLAETVPVETVLDGIVLDGIIIRSSLVNKSVTKVILEHAKDVTKVILEHANSGQGHPWARENVTKAILETRTQT